MGWLAIALGVVLALLALVNPRAMWDATAAWRYRNPEANRPSEALFAVRRVVVGVGAVLLVVLGIVINAQNGSDVRPEADRVATALAAGNPVMLESGDVGDSLNSEEALSTLGLMIGAELSTDFQVSNRAAVSASEYRFTLITNDGEDAHCLRVGVVGDPVVETDTVAAEPGQPPVEYRVGLRATIETSVTEGVC